MVACTLIAHLLSPAAAETGMVSRVAPADTKIAPPAPLVPLIPRDVLFANPDRAQVRLSPDGLWISYLAPRDGVLNLWIRPADAQDDAHSRPITDDRGRGIRRHVWTHSGRHVVFVRDDTGSEDWRLFSADINTGVVIPLTPPGCQARLVATPPALQSEILVSLNKRDPALHDLYAIDAATGAARLLRIAPPGASDWVVDQAGKVRFVERTSNDGGLELLRPEPDGSWTPALRIPPEDAITTRVLGFGHSASHLYLSDSRGRDTAALVRLDLDTGDSTVLAENPRADLDDVLRDPASGDVQAVAFREDRLRWSSIDPAVTEDLALLQRQHDAEVTIASRSLDDRRWLVAVWDDDGPMSCHLYERDATPPRSRFLFHHRDRLANAPLAPMRAVQITASDGLPLTGYLTLPLQAPSNPSDPRHLLPMVLLVHGGPWARDSWGYSPLHQLLANRGYAVLSVNFRASTGFGKAFVNAGDREWGGRIQQDLTDSVYWAIDQGIADPARVAIVGGSFGGYAAQCGLALTPDLYACAVSVVGPSDLNTLLDSIPPYWAPLRALFTRRVGDTSTPEGREFLRERSPLTHADRIRRPLLLVHGANDPRVRLSESQRMAQTLDDAGVPVTLVVFPDEGHGLARPENNLAYIALLESFLAQHLGGRYQSLDQDVEASSARVPIGGKWVGLPDDPVP